MYVFRWEFLVLLVIFEVLSIGKCEVLCFYYLFLRSFAGNIIFIAKNSLES